ncbi:putative oxygenase MesX [Pedobacter sp. Leaf170]|uniref:putative oxygenase MesX n=1 Tax=Pedobacter sp. Leaf170 TaxID=2876558 RepID=UPI001E43730F|nr:putative oxygenase MesX [Pedobacter sp. Leaf170]
MENLQDTQGNDFVFSLKRTCLDENYYPSDQTRLTTNFANLARGTNRWQNLHNALNMINNRFNSLAHVNNPKGDRYHVQLEILTITMRIDDRKGLNDLPMMEVLKTNIFDRKTGQQIEGVAGNNFSSYVRDYDFSVLLTEHNKDKPIFTVPENFGDLHDKLYKCFVNSQTYKDHFKTSPIICLSVSGNKSYTRTEYHNAVLGFEYLQDQYSLTDEYFSKMGLKVRYFMPPNAVAPMAFYHSGDLLCDYTDFGLISSISTMETFQKIYRPEIYNANSAAGKIFKPSLKNEDYSLTRVEYDRLERSRLAVEQGKYAEQHFIKPYQNVLEQWSANFKL